MNAITNAIAYVLGFVGCLMVVTGEDLCNIADDLFKEINKQEEI